MKQPMTSKSSAQNITWRSGWAKKAEFQQSLPERQRALHIAAASLKFYQVSENEQGTLFRFCNGVAVDYAAAARQRALDGGGIGCTNFAYGKPVLGTFDVTDKPEPQSGRACKFFKHLKRAMSVHADCALVERGLHSRSSRVQLLRRCHIAPRLQPCTGR